MPKLLGMIGVALMLQATGAAAQTETRLGEPVLLAATSVGMLGTRTEGSGRVTAQVRSLAGFMGVRVMGPINLELKAAEAERVTVRIDDNLQDFIETRVVPGVVPILEIGIFRGAAFKTRETPTVVVEFTNLTRLSLQGSGRADADAVRGKALQVSIAGSGNVAIKTLEVGQLEVAVAGSGDFTARGRAEEQRLNIAGSGDIDTAKLPGNTVAVSISGSGNANVRAERSLDVSIAGSGDVLYVGNPAVQKSVAGSGSVKARRE